ncbi:olfactory receptor 10AG1-like [Choloepus didactylus]|uniref:olfactory receptor 10AG1-like n=1 Tax=Choloepus didactylus TaxID=27675 RepID=UPI00189CA421|nr:olfactory receptor 10AG1-like [Choloepus didactylus]
MLPRQQRAEGNFSSVVGFVLLGFSDLPNLQGLLFGIFSLMYTFIIIGNGIIMIITVVDSALQTPMYFFLANFSSLGVCYVSVTVPRILVNLWTRNRSISLLSCATQMCFFLMLGSTESFLLAVMAYDRYVAICNPLLYPVVMNQKVCTQLAVGSWISGIPVQIGQTFQVFSLPFCGSNQINHFFCDIPLLIKLACGDTKRNEICVYLVFILFSTIPFVLILSSYFRIISTILKMPSTASQFKAFSTCSSHLIVVVLFFGPGTITYLRPKSNHSAGTDKMFSLFYIFVTPLFNPIIYSLRNRDVIAALKRLLPKRTDRRSL